jgi:hypothetical protein
MKLCCGDEYARWGPAACPGWARASERERASLTGGRCNPAILPDAAHQNVLTTPLGHLGPSARRGHRGSVGCLDVSRPAMVRELAHAAGECRRGRDPARDAGEDEQCRLSAERRGREPPAKAPSGMEPHATRRAAPRIRQLPRSFMPAAHLRGVWLPRRFSHRLVVPPAARRVSSRGPGSLPAAFVGGYANDCKRPGASASCSSGPAVDGHWAEG